MKKLFEKNPLGFSLLWIGLYMSLMYIASLSCGGFVDLPSKTPLQMLVPAACSLVLCTASTIWIFRSGLQTTFGLCGFRGKGKQFLWFSPLILISCINLTNGLRLSASFSISFLMALHFALSGYMEELIFRGFLFRTMERKSLRSALIISAASFGAGHIANLFSSANTFGIVLQVLYATVIGFLFATIVYKGGSLWPCIASHMFINATSVFAAEDGPFKQLVSFLFSDATLALIELCSALFVILIAGGYAVWLWRKD